jgi:hypothetical protein
MQSGLTRRGVPLERGAETKGLLARACVVIATGVIGIQRPPTRRRAEAKVRIDQIEVIESALPVRDLRLVLAWAELHQAELLQNWRRARAGETLLEIEPLRWLD